MTVAQTEGCITADYIGFVRPWHPISRGLGM